MLSQEEDPLNRRPTSSLYFLDVTFGELGWREAIVPGSASLQRCVVKESEDQYCVHVSLLRVIFIVSLDTVSSSPP